MRKYFFCLLVVIMSCHSEEKKSGKNDLVQLITLDPGHFHAALVQKNMYENVDSIVHVYAPVGNDLELHLNRIKAFNTRTENPSHWKEDVYTGNDFFQKMIAEKKGNVVVLSGNNQKKTSYILGSLENGMNVLADKPMVIDSIGFTQLQKAFAIAEKNNLLLYDIMTERYEITTMLQRELSMIPEIFGTLEKGTPENPAITKESVHHFYKFVSGTVLTRPAWFLDVSQQGEGIVDVMTHLVDLVQWECFPGQAIDYKKDISVNSAKRWATSMNPSEFKAITKLDSFPSYLNKNITNDTILQVYCNGEINYQLKGVHARTSVVWRYAAPDGSGDTHHSMMRGTKSNLVIVQGKEENYLPVLYIEPTHYEKGYELALAIEIKKIQDKYPGVELKRAERGWQLIIPEKYREGHESHFGRVMEKFLEYLKNRNMPEWEVPNMIAKYWTTTKALDMAERKE
jgi:predicted dehydrogenase